MHRAIISLIEELEAIDWYQQRAEACEDEGLREVLLHNKNEEIEHALMTLEWIRRRDPVFDQNARMYLFSNKSLVNLEYEESESDSADVVHLSFEDSLGIGSLKK